MSRTALSLVNQPAPERVPVVYEEACAAADHLERRAAENELANSVADLLQPPT